MAHKVCLAAMLLLFSPLVVTSCGTPDAADTPPPAPIDPFQACIDVCTHGNEQCMEPGADCDTWCEQLFRNATPQCQEEVAAEWACVAPAMEAHKDYCTYPAECTAASQTRDDCVDEFGCTTHGWGEGGIRGCVTLLPGPNNEPRCRCMQFCAQHDYMTDCLTQDATTTCKCYKLDPSSLSADQPDFYKLLGTCEGGPLCEEDLDQSCCNQYFNIVL
jgi:hypothetical protein